MSLFTSKYYPDPRDLHSFPTRRSSDLCSPEANRRVHAGTSRGRYNSNVCIEVPEIGGNVSIRPGKKVVEDDRCDPILIMGAARLDPIIGEAARDVGVGNSESRLWIDNGEPGVRVYLVAGNYAVSRKTFGFLEILSRLARHPD